MLLSSSYSPTAGQEHYLMLAKRVSNSRRELFTAQIFQLHITGKKETISQASSIDAQNFYRKHLPSDTFGW
jgi:hypothetical protein